MPSLSADPGAAGNDGPDPPAEVVDVDPSRSPGGEAAPDPADEPERGRHGFHRPPLIPGMVRKAGPKTLQNRLTLGFAGVVALTLFLVTVFVLNRLDDEFRTQEMADLGAKTDLVAAYIDFIAGDLVFPQPVVSTTNVVNPKVVALFRDDERASFIPDHLAEADVDFVLGQAPIGHGDASAVLPAQDGTFHAGTVEPARAGMRKETIVGSWVLRPAQNSPFVYAIVVRLSNPYTFRQSAIDNVTTVAAAVGALALGIAVIVAAAMALWVTTPLRRMTEASRALAAGD